MVNWRIVTTLKQIVLILPHRRCFPITLARISIKEFNEQKLLYIAYSYQGVQTAYGPWHTTRQPSILKCPQRNPVVQVSQFPRFPATSVNRPIKTPSETHSVRVSDNIISIEIG